MDVFVIETPLQLLNAVEAKQRFRSNKATLVLIRWPAWPDSAFSDVLALTGWTDIKNIAFGIRRPSYPASLSQLEEYHWILLNARRRRRLNRLIDEIGTCNRLFLGSYHAGNNRHWANRATFSELIVLDDGTDTLHVASARLGQQQNDLGSNTAVTGWKKLKAAITRRFVDLDIRPVDSLTFFSCYDLPIRAGDSYIRNDYAELRKLLADREKTNEIYFLGQPLVEDGYLDLEGYLSELKKVKGHLAGQTIIYIPHKREATQTVDMVRQELDVAVRRFDAPIEIELVTSKQYPKIVGSFFCSALETCRVIFDGEIGAIAYEVDIERLLLGKDETRRIYDYFRSKTSGSFSVVKTS